MTLNEFCMEAVLDGLLAEGEARLFKRWVSPTRADPPPTLVKEDWQERLQMFRKAAIAAQQGDSE